MHKIFSNSMKFVQRRNHIYMEDVHISKILGISLLFAIELNLYAHFLAHFPSEGRDANYISVLFI